MNQLTVYGLSQSIPGREVRERVLLKIFTPKVSSSVAAAPPFGSTKACKRRE